MPKRAKRVSLRALEKALLRWYRSLPVRRAHRAWMKTIAEEPTIDAMLRGKGDYRTRHLQSYLHRRWGAAEKLAVIQAHVTFLQQTVPAHYHEMLYGQPNAEYGTAEASGPGIELMAWSTPAQEWKLLLIRAQHNKEGELQLSLRDGADREVYFLVFSIGLTRHAPHQRVLYVGCVQGARPEQGGTELINAFYKQHHGLRAQGFLMTALYALAEVFEIPHLYGIADGYTINSRYRAKIKTSYDTFWEECHGERQLSGWYRLPEQEVLRSVDTVKSKHRSAFRKREAWREAARAELVAALRALRSTSVSR